MPRMSLDAGDGTELAELLQLLADWIEADQQALSPSFGRFINDPAYDITQLREDINRHIFLLGGSDGEALFEPW
ncbi:hypothetical protein [Sinomonas sp.]|uniref:hypothetical protein n=1 Tax=Sinomonas sp. TaxID=1914986 RepID=UPI003F822FCB